MHLDAGSFQKQFLLRQGLPALVIAFCSECASHSQPRENNKNQSIYSQCRGAAIFLCRFCDGSRLLTQALQFMAPGDLCAYVAAGVETSTPFRSSHEQLEQLQNTQINKSKLVYMPQAMWRDVWDIRDSKE